MKNYKLPKEFAKKWLAALRSGEYKQGGGTLLSYEEKDDLTKDFNKKSYCCLGVACSLTEISESMYSGEPFIDEGYDIDTAYVLKKGYPKELVGEKEKSLPYILSLLNDGITKTDYIIRKDLSEFSLRKPLNPEEEYKLNFSEIADFIEDNVEFY